MKSINLLLFLTAIYIASAVLFLMGGDYSRMTWVTTLALLCLAAWWQMRKHGKTFKSVFNLFLALSAVYLIAAVDYAFSEQYLFAVLNLMASGASLYFIWVVKEKAIVTQVLITTPDAVFTVMHMTRRFLKQPFPFDSWARMYAKSYPHHLVEMTRRGRRLFSSGPIELRPRIWTHVPVPYGMNIQAVHARFQERVVSVLGDYDSPVDLSPDPFYPDGRYQAVSVRTAWMMYLDLAIEQFISE